LLTDLDNTSETDGTSHRCCDKIRGGKTAEKTEAVDRPGIQGPFPFTLRVPFQGPPEGEELDSQDRVEKGTYEGGDEDHGPMPTAHDRRNERGEEGKMNGENKPRVPPAPHRSRKRFNSHDMTNPY
jgi:hypothetical protein